MTCSDPSQQGRIDDSTITVTISTTLVVVKIGRRRACCVQTVHCNDYPALMSSYKSQDLDNFCRLPDATYEGIASYASSTDHL
jgi:hypothetical protein